MKYAILAAGMAAAAFAGSAANAATTPTTIKITKFDISNYTSATAGFTAFEFFEGIDAGQHGGDPIVSLSVGSFRTLGGTGTGSICSQNGGVPCNSIAVQDFTDEGQGNILPDGGKRALSSNDTKGIVWDAKLAGDAFFNRLVFAVRDVADQGPLFSVTANGTTESVTGQNNNNLQLVVVDFSDLVNFAEVTMTSTENDGFNFDGAAGGIAPVPLPAGGLLLVGGLAALGAVRKRKAAKAAAAA